VDILLFVHFILAECRYEIKQNIEKNM